MSINVSIMHAVAALLVHDYSGPAEVGQIGDRGEGRIEVSACRLLLAW